MTPAFFSELFHSSVDKEILLLMIMIKRLGITVIYAILKKRGMEKLFLALFPFWMGFSYGWLLEVILLSYGPRGILLFLFMIFPQGLLYPAGYLKLLKGGRGTAIFILLLGCITEVYFNLMMVFFIH